MKHHSHVASGKKMWAAGLLTALCVLFAAWSAEARGCLGDKDCDGLTNQEERALGTNPRSADTDHDGLSDEVEVDKVGSDPTKADTDADGAEDGDEEIAGTDPKDTDSDHDGTADGEDNDPADELEAKLVGPVDSADATAKTVTIFGLVVDASGAELDDGLMLDALSAGTVVKIKLDGSKLPALVAKEIKAEDRDHDGKPDDHDDDDNGDGTPDDQEG